MNTKPIMKPEAYYVLSAAYSLLTLDVDEMLKEVDTLDPVASMGVRFRLARMAGVIEYMKKELDNYDETE